MAETRKLAAILAADVVGYSKFAYRTSTRCRKTWASANCGTQVRTRVLRQELPPFAREIRETRLA